LLLTKVIDTKQFYASSFDGSVGVGQKTWKQSLETLDVLT